MGELAALPAGTGARPRRTIVALGDVVTPLLCSTDAWGVPTLLPSRQVPQGGRYLQPRALGVRVKGCVAAHPLALVPGRPLFVQLLWLSLAFCIPGSV